MMRTIKADLTLMPEGLVSDLSISFNLATGYITNISSDCIEAEYLGKRSIVIPGFINGHCHLELSYLKGKISEQKGLASFIKELQIKKIEIEEGQKYSKLADKEMYESGIVVVADTCNLLDSKNVKEQSKIKYINLVEGFGLNDQTDYYSELKFLGEGYAPLEYHLVPHASYSTNRKLIKQLSTDEHSRLISIHNQETKDERLFFQNQSGNLYTLMQSFYSDLTINTFDSSIHYFLPLMPKKKNKILVHNTFTSKEDIRFAYTINEMIYWCFCPKANLYIEGELPHFDQFKPYKEFCMIGTDSLASNDSLNVLEELKYIQKNSSFTLQDLLFMATKNPAKALNISDFFGNLKRDKNPGLNVIFFDNDNYELNDKTKLKKIV